MANFIFKVRSTRNRTYFMQIIFKVILINFLLILFIDIGISCHNHTALSITINKNTCQDSIPSKSPKKNEVCNLLQDSIIQCRSKIAQLEVAVINLKTENERSKKQYTEINENLRKHYGVDGNKAYRVKYKLNTFDCYEVDLLKSKISFHLKDDNGKSISSLYKLNSIIGKMDKIMVFATNGGMYTPEQNPQGLFIQNRNKITQLDTRTGLYGNFYLQPNGVFYVDTCNYPGIVQTPSFNDDLSKSVEFATQSGPLLVIDNVYNSIFKEGSENTNIRNGVGINEKGKVIFVISNEKINFYDFAQFFKEKLKCANALYLDGAISETYLPEIGRFQNGGNFGPIIAVTKK
jgi:uncharacterized protein YigE (DUF2233 family)